MASIKERIETVFAAMAFAEMNLDAEARDVLGEARERKSAARPRESRPDNRPRVRV